MLLGLGAIMAKSLDANGAKNVFILGRRLDKLEEVASQAVGVYMGLGNNKKPT